MRIVLMIGITGSGKSSYVDKHLKSYQLICQDDIRETIGGEFITTWAFFHSKDRYREISANDAVAKTSCEALMKRGRDIVIDDLNIDPEKIKEWLDLADKYKYSKYAIIFNTPLDECLKRRDDCPSIVIKEIQENLTTLLENKPLMNRFDLVKGTE